MFGGPLYSIGGVVSMHPTVLYCSPMKERDEALREETNSREGEDVNTGNNSSFTEKGSEVTSGFN